MREPSKTIQNDKKWFLAIFEILLPGVGFDPRTPGIGSKYLEAMGEPVDLLGIPRKKTRKVKKLSFSIKSLRHQVFPGGPPSKYYPGPTMLNFRDQTRTGVFIVVWS